MRCIVANLVDGGGNELAEVVNMCLLFTNTSSSLFAIYYDYVQLVMCVCLYVCVGVGL